MDEAIQVDKGAQVERIAVVGGDHVRAKAVDVFLVVAEIIELVAVVNVKVLVLAMALEALPLCVVNAVLLPPGIPLDGGDNAALSALPVDTLGGDATLLSRGA